jgi:hypothetical protein
VYKLTSQLAVVILSLLASTLSAQINFDTLFTSSVYKPSFATITSNSLSNYTSYELTEPVQADSADSILVRENAALKYAIPNSKNYEKYYAITMACTRMKDTAAERMLLTIYHSPLKQYCQNWYHSSDVKTKQKKQIYSYGSYTNNYKHYVAIELMRIELKKKNPQKALSYLQAADTLYTVNYTCGTGYLWHKSSMNSYFSLCYYESERYEDVLKIAFTDPFYNWSAFADSALLKLYSEKQLLSFTNEAERTITFIPDTISMLCMTSTTDSAGNWITKDSSWYRTGKASTTLLGYKIEWTPGIYDIREVNGELATEANRETAVFCFRRSAFYQAMHANGGN